MTTEPATTRSNGYAWLVLGILSFVYVLNFLDRQLLSILAKPIQDDLGITDGQLGRLGGLYFAMFYCILGVPVAWLADRGNRVRVLSIACALWSAATIACGMSATYGQLAAARMIGRDPAVGRVEDKVVVERVDEPGGVGVGGPHQRSRAMSGRKEDRAR